MMEKVEVYRSELEQLIRERDSYKARFEEFITHIHVLLPLPAFRVTPDGVEALDTYGVGKAFKDLRDALDRASNGVRA